MRYRSSLPVVMVLTVTACVEPLEGELEEVTQAENGRRYCDACGMNGVNAQTYNYVFAQMDRNALNQHGAWDSSTTSPTSVCKPWTITATDCEMRGTWSNWLNANPHFRVPMMTYVAKLIAPDNFSIRDPNGYTYWGDFNLAPEARGSSWGIAGMEYVSGGILALLNAVDGVPVCLATERVPGSCSGSAAPYHESTIIGNAIYGSRFMAIIGGAHATNPNLNLRYGKMMGVSATAYAYSSGRCGWAGSGETAYATYCDADDGTRWQWPIFVHTPFLPSEWYYNVGVEKPKPTPIVY